MPSSYPGLDKIFVRLLALATLAGALVLGISTTRVIRANAAIHARLVAEEHVVSSLTAESSSLVAESSYRQSPAYVEKVAREQLNMVRPGDRVLRIHVEQATSVTATSTVARPKLPPKKLTPTQEPTVPLWRQWLNLLVGTK